MSKNLCFNIFKKSGPSRTFSQAGFTLVEILVAMFLVALLFTTLTVSVGTFSPHTKLENSLNNIERALRFASDEAALRNSVVRVRFLLDKSPQEFVVEYGPDDNFVIPKRLVEFNTTTSLEQDEQKDKLLKKINKRFSRVDEFKESNEELDEVVKMIGMGTDLYESLVSEGEVSIYVYPTGEKDSGIIFLGTSEEVATLKVDAFDMDFVIDYYKIDGENTEDLQESLLEKAKEIFVAWLKK